MTRVWSECLYGIEYAAVFAGLVYLTWVRRRAPRATRIGVAGFAVLFVLGTYHKLHLVFGIDDDPTVGGLLKWAGLVESSTPVNQWVNRVVPIVGYWLLIWAVVADRRSRPPKEE